MLFTFFNLLADTLLRISKTLGFTLKNTQLDSTRFFKTKVARSFAKIKAREDRLEITDSLKEGNMSNLSRTFQGKSFHFC